MLPFDLHVLGLPPAFTLSQDQTLHLKLHARRQIALDAESAQLHYSLYVYLRTNTLKLMVLIERLLMVNCHHQTPAQVTCAHCQRSANVGLSAWFVSRRDVSVEVSRTSYKGFCCRQHPVMVFFGLLRHEAGSGSMILADLAAGQQAGFQDFSLDHA